MPKPVRPQSLTRKDALQNLTDDLFRPKPTRSSSPRSSPSVSPVDLSCTRGILPPLDPIEEKRLSKLDELRRYITQLPASLQQDLIDRLCLELEAYVQEDRDRKLILTLINIDRVNYSNFFFGVHSLLSIVDPLLAVQRLPFTRRFWACLWDYEHLTTAHLLQEKLCDAIPNFTKIKELSVAYFANNKMCYLLSRYLPQLEHLVLDHSEVNDRGIFMLMGGSATSSSASPRSQDLVKIKDPFRKSLRCEVLNSSDESMSGNSSLRNVYLMLSALRGPTSISRGCRSLKHLSLEGCAQITDAGVWSALSSCPPLEYLVYHQTDTVAEVVNKYIGAMSSSECESFRMSLKHYTHPFPYRLPMQSDLIDKINLTCPYLTSLTMVTDDDFLENYTMLKGLRSVTVELEDCFGLGLYAFLEKMGPQLEELVISCGSDPDSADLPDGGQPYELFNVSLQLALRFCNPQCFTKLSVSGCGLVSSGLMRKLEEVKSPSCIEHSRSLSALQRLIFLSYEDDNPVRTCDEKILLQFLAAAPNLRWLSLEGNFTPYFTDTFIDKLLDVNPLNQLNIFDVGGAIPFSAQHLSISSARKLCTLDQISELRLDKWPLQLSQIRELEELVRAKGWQLTITKDKPVAHNPMP